jgi:predicted nucleic acid-binding protein
VTGPGILVDSWAWLEMMSGSRRGERACEVIRDNSGICVSVLTLYELRYRLEQIKNREGAVLILKQIVDQAEVIPVDAQIALLGGTIKARQHSRKITMGAVDCLILATARTHNLNVLTGDTHFKGFEETILL